ncbi:hypothetical protein [Lachnoclostridium sp. An14]|uniref:hypothetical protein n=1 Tax=Lachnoclostridium sp. An14 TaxID=1965562 RepID=UPI0013A60BD1|nr:hypothetical protein [Lachnoclostridium sp. An14]
MEAVECKVVETRKWRAMSRHVDKLRGQLEEARRWCIVQTVIIALLTGALTYVLMCGA